METINDFESVVIYFVQNSYSLGILIEWKPNILAIAESKIKDSYSLGILIEWKRDFDLFFLAYKIFDSYSLGILIEWKPT